MSRAGLCTCHEPPRPMTQESPQHEWGHDDTEDYAEVFHVHHDSHSVDCDGPMDHSHTMQVTSLVDCESADDLWRIAVRLEVHAYAEQTITIHGETKIASFTERTDEGGRSTELRGCTEPWCAHDEASQRDYYAEAMGY